MIQSMTGYGKACAAFGNKKIHAEVKSLNSKALDLTTRVAPLYREKEMELRALIARRLERGKVDFNLWTEEDTAVQAQINLPLAESYDRQLRVLAAKLGFPWPNAETPGTLLRLPDVVSRDEAQELDPEEWIIARKTTEQALDRLEDFRRQEGAALEGKFREKLDNIGRLLADLEPYEAGRVTRVRERLIEALESIPAADYDRNRLEQELIYYIEKLDISEEKQRLANHLRYFRETMESGHGQGKKLGFIAQEMGREINTTGSKSNQAEMQNLVVQMKDELEQIKEQVLNVM